jgi:hypothetical protein
MRKVMRDRVRREDEGDVGCESRAPSGIGGKRCVAGGAKKSDSEPVRRRARVEVRAMVVTWVEGDPAGGDAPVGYD